MREKEGHDGAATRHEWEPLWEEDEEDEVEEAEQLEKRTILRTKEAFVFFGTTPILR